MKINLVSTTELAGILNVKVQTIRKWRLYGKGPGYIRFGNKYGRVLYRSQDIEEWLKNNKFSSTAEEKERRT